MTVHFWPGRGLNSGIKAGMALGDEIVLALNNGKFQGLDITAMKEYNDFIMKLQGREHDKRSIPILNQSGSPEMLGWLLEKAHAIPDNVAMEWLVGAMTQIGARLQGRNDWNYDIVPNVEPQIRIVLRQMRSLTLREMAVSFPWPTREMAGAEVLPIRTMKPEEKQTWVNQLWKMLTDEKDKDKGKKSEAAVKLEGEVIPTGRFEAPKQQPGMTRPRSRSPNPAALLEVNSAAAGLKRSGARSVRSNAPRATITKGIEDGLDTMSIAGDYGDALAAEEFMSRPRSHSRSGSLAVPGDEEDDRRGRSSSRGGDSLGVPTTNGHARKMSSAGDGLVRLMSTRQKPGNSVLTEAMSLALFRVGDE